MSLPLDGLVFLEAGGSPSGSYAGRLLRLLGADVVLALDAGELGAGRAAGHRTGFRSDGKLLLLLEGDPRVHAEVLERLPVAGAIDACGALPHAPYPVVSPMPGADPEVEWASCGAMALTGEVEGPPVFVPGWHAAHLSGAVAALALLAGVSGWATPDARSRLAALDGPALLGERAALAGYARAGSLSPGGTTRLMRSRDGWVAMTLSRPSDVDALEAWMRSDWSGDPWLSVQGALECMGSREAVARAQLLGIAASVAAAPSEALGDEQSAARGQTSPPTPFVVDEELARLGAAVPLRSAASVPRTRPVAERRAPLVADMSGLWAGPMCASLLAGAGARVVKVEGKSRPDGARGGPAAFFDLMNAGKEALSVDLATPADRQLLATLLGRADLVVQSSRPRAMEALGIEPGRMARGVRETWLSITAYGRSGPWREWCGFGDDVAAAAGLAVLAGEAAGLDHPVHCADAYADPVTGLHGAVAALAGLVGGGGHFLDVAMRDVVRHMLGGHTGPSRSSDTGGQEVAPPRARPRRGRANALGRDDLALRAEFCPLRAEGPARDLAASGR